MYKALKIAVVGNPGSWSTEALAQHIRRLTGSRLVVDLAKVIVDLQAGRALYQGVDLCQYDALIVKKVSRRYGSQMLDRVEMLRFIEACGVAVFSKPASLLRLLDRISCTLTLNAADIPMPPTVITEDVVGAVQTVKEYGCAVLKPLFSTKARGMRKLSAEQPDLEQQVQAFSHANPVMYLQKFIDIPEQDLGVLFIGGEYIGAYARVKRSGAWSTSTVMGGSYAAHEPSASLVDLARRAQSLFDLDLTSVDLVQTAEGPLVFEVSAFGGFRGLKEAQGIDVAGMYVQWVLRQLKSR